jgi:hypothetical protein
VDDGGYIGTVDSGTTSMSLQKMLKTTEKNIRKFI